MGLADVFVSHAWKYLFADLVAAIEAFAAEHDRAEAFFWVDNLVVNQHVNNAAGFEWWSSTFKQSVQGIGHTLLVLAPARRRRRLGRDVLSEGGEGPLAARRAKAVARLGALAATAGAEHLRHRLVAVATASTSAACSESR